MMTSFYVKIRVQLTVRRAYSPEGGPGFGYPQMDFALLEVP